MHIMAKQLVKDNRAMGQVTEQEENERWNSGVGPTLKLFSFLSLLTSATTSAVVMCGISYYLAAKKSVWSLFIHWSISPSFPLKIYYIN